MKKRSQRIDYISGTESAYKMTEQEELAYEEQRAGVYDDDFDYNEMLDFGLKETNRKQMPVFSGVLKYFPDAIREVAKTS